MYITVINVYKCGNHYCSGLQTVNICKTLVIKSEFSQKLFEEKCYFFHAKLK